MAPNATTTKQSLSLTTSRPITSSGKLVAFLPPHTCTSPRLLYVALQACPSVRVHQPFQTNVGRGAEAQPGDFWGPGPVPEGPGLQRWLRGTQRTRRCSDGLSSQNQDGRGVLRCLLNLMGLMPVMRISTSGLLLLLLLFFFFPEAVFLPHIAGIVFFLIWPHFKYGCPPH